MNKNIRITGVTTTNNVITVHGTFGEENRLFAASPFQWAKKMLMKVTSTHTFTQGEKVAIGHASKKALKTASLALPEAKLVRPRKAKEEPVVEVEPTPEA